MRIAAYPGSFNPPTRAHLAIARAAVGQRSVERVDLVVSRVALAKEGVERPRLEHRLEVLSEITAEIEWLDVVLSDHQLIADLATGYDLVIMGADKWAQVNDPAFYDGSNDARDHALARLPELAIAPRGGVAAPEQHQLMVDSEHHFTSSSSARDGRHDLMLPEAAAFDETSGAWTDPSRYARYLDTQP